MTAFDNRIFKVVLTWGDGQSLTLDGGLDITAQGVMYANPLQDECNLTIANLKRDTRDALATQLRVFNYDQKRKTVTLYAGRESTGLFQLYTGDIVDCSPSQPPDILLSIRSKTCQFYKTDILAQAYTISTPLSTIAKGVASSMGLTPTFQATDKMVANYSYTGSALKQVDKLQAVGGVDAYISGNELVCKDRGKPLANVSHTLSAKTGMIGIPQASEWGVTARCLLAPVRVGSQLDLVSEMNPLLTGKYTIYQVSFDIASRATPFDTIIEATQYPDLYFNTAIPQA